MSSFQSFDDACTGRQYEKPLPYGVTFLDDATGGIRKNDLVVIGGRTGTGKTELVTKIAQTNALNCKRVHVFSLESEPGEFHNRIKFRILSKKWYESTKETLRYRKWIMGHYLLQTKEMERGINSYLNTAMSDLDVFYRTSGEFGAAELKAYIYQIHEKTDLIIIDHLHYLDFDDVNELKAIKNIVKEVRDLSLLYGKPIILVAHLRKKDRNNNDLAPGLDEFHGTSDITKIATQVITLAPCYGIETESHLFPTALRVSKNRIDNSASIFYGLHVFDSRNNNYDKAYKLARVSDCKKGDFVESDSSPWWAEGVEDESYKEWSGGKDKVQGSKRDGLFGDR